MTPEQHTALRLELLERGYAPLATKGKRPTMKKWPTLEIDEESIRKWGRKDHLVTTGVRVEGDLLVFDFDIDSAEVLGKIEARIEEENPELWDLMLGMPKRYGGGDKYALFARKSSGKYEQYWSKAYYKPGDLAAGDGKAPLQRLEVFTGGGSEGRYLALYGAHTVADNDDIVVSYRWEEDDLGPFGLADIDLDQLPAVPLKQVKWLVDLVSDVLHGTDWEYEVGASHGKVERRTSYTLMPEMIFSASDGYEYTLEDLDAACDHPDLRVAMGFVVTGASNTSRGSVSRNGADGRVQIYDFASGVTYRPVELDMRMKMQSLGSALLRSPHLYVSDPANESDGERRPFMPVGDGELTAASAQIARYLAGQEHLFDMGGRIVAVLDGAIIPMDVDRLAVEIGRRVCCVTKQMVAGAERMVECDPSVKLVKMVQSLLLESRFRKLRAITDIPVLRRDGSMVKDGYCKETQLVVRALPGVAEMVPEGSVSVQEAERALKVLWEPFVQFPFVSEADRGGMLAALLTAVLRPVLPTAPAFGMDAPTQGSGKSLLCRCVGWLSGTFLVQPPLPVKDDDEVRKVLLTVLMEAPRAVVFDNMLGMLDSGALGAVLTSESFSGRILGTNTSLKAPTSVLIMLNGNNLALAGDMPRRVVTVRIDPQDEVPHARKFKFDPEVEVRTRRVDMIAAALTLVKAALGSAVKGRVGSFEMWDEMVGQTVAWVERHVDGQFSDPAKAIEEAVRADPKREELSHFMSSLRTVFGNEWFSAAEAASFAGPGQPLAEAFETQGTPSSRSVGRFLTFRKDGRVGGFTLQAKRDSRTKVFRFRVWSSEDSAESVVTGSFQARRVGAAKITQLTPKS
jgi:hypothetical protein